MLVLCHKVGHLGFYIHLVLFFCGKVLKNPIFLYFPYISYRKTVKIEKSFSLGLGNELGHKNRSWSFLSLWVKNCEHISQKV